MGAAVKLITDTGGRAAELLRQASGLALSGQQKAWLREAYRLEQGTKSQRREAVAICNRIERELRAGLNETIALEQARGGDVHDPQHGPARIRSRDGLRSLFDAEHLTRPQYEAGLAYRRLHEALSHDLKSQLADEVTSGNVDAVRRKLERAKRLDLRARIDRAVVLQLRDRPEALNMLRAIAGEGVCMDRFVNGSRGFANRVGDLVAALSIAADLSKAGHLTKAAG